MQLFPIGKTFDFMGKRRLFIPVSMALVLASLVSLFIPGPLMGTDFQGGTELEVAFRKPVTAGHIKDAAAKAGFAAPMAVKVDDENNPNRFLIRVQDVSTISELKQAEVESALCYGDNLPKDRCPPERETTEVKFSPGGDKITVRFSTAPDLEWIKTQATSVAGVSLRAGANNPFVQNARAHRVEIQLKSKGDQLLDALRASLAPDSVPDAALRVEWIGPKAGAQLRDAAIKSILISLVFIMGYVAVRFDLRFAPGAVVALVHDALVTAGVLVVLQQMTGQHEFSLSTVAALLTIVGYSVNDTVVVFDRVRENLGKLRGSTFIHIINVSLSEMLSRTILTSGTTIFSLLAFFVWGTGSIEEFALTLIIGIVLGTYSSIYIALPLTEWLDKKFFAKVSAKTKRRPHSAKKVEAAV